ncbi:TPA: diadenosine tetraphosphatase, partial [Neisseria meningitidis]
MIFQNHAVRTATLSHFTTSAMAHYAIGDIQGCFDELTALLGKIGF